MYKEIYQAGIWNDKCTSFLLLENFVIKIMLIFISYEIIIIEHLLYSNIWIYIIGLANRFIFFFFL